MKDVSQLNATLDVDAHAAFLRCCGSTKWASRMTAERPFQDMESLLSASDRVWWSLDAEDWLEAFRAHPKIGEKKPAPSGSGSWATEEQSGASNASQGTQAALTQANLDYEKEFGYIFIVCATGKSAEEMLVLLNTRLSNDPYDELRIAADEQCRITHLRLGKLLSEMP